MPIVIKWDGINDANRKIRIEKIRVWSSFLSISRTSTVVIERCKSSAWSEHKFYKANTDKRDRLSKRSEDFEEIAVDSSSSSSSSSFMIIITDDELITMFKPVLSPRWWEPRGRACLDPLMIDRSVIDCAFFFDFLSDFYCDLFPTVG